jgi:hypothetical protein
VSNKYKFNTRWKDKELKCSCLYGNPTCDRFRSCEVLEFTLNPYDGVEQVMKERSYKRDKGSIKQVRSV